EQEPALAGVFFLGPPIVVDHELYVIGERNNEITLYALDQATGRLRWTQQLAHSDPRARFGYIYGSHRRRAGAVPSYGNGVLVCPTSSGAIVAVDVASRSLLWGYQYPLVMNQRSSSRTSPSGRWLDSSVTISDGKVIVTPVESSHMHCLNLSDGGSVWKRPVSRVDNLFVAGVHKGIVSVVGKHAMVGFDLESGVQKWSQKIDVRKRNDGVQNLPVGFGFRTGDHYFLPTVDRILKVDVVAGKIVDSIDCDDAIGNIVAYDGKIISLGLDYLRLYHQSDRLAEAVESKLKESPNDPWALEQRGALFFDAGDVDKGLSALRKAIESYPTGAPERDRATRLLVSVALVVLERDYASNIRLADELDRWIDRPQDRQRYLLLRANGMLAAKQPRQAFDAFSKMIFANRTKQVKYASITKDAKSQHVVRDDRAIRAGMVATLKMASPSESREMLSNLKSRCDELLSLGDINRIESTINELGNLPVVDELRLYAADKLSGEQAIAAELLLLPVLDSQDPRLAAEAYCRTAEIYAASDYHRAAARYYATAREKWPTTKLKGGQTVEELCEAISETSSVGKYLRSGPQWAYGAAKFGQIPKSPGDRGPSLLVSIVRQRSNGNRQSPQLDFWHDRNDFVATDRLGRERARFASGSYQRYTLSVRPTTTWQLGSLCFVNVGNLVAAVDTLQSIDPTKTIRQRPDPVLWPDYQVVRQNKIGRADIGSRPIWKQSMEFPRNRKIYEIATASVNGVVYLRGSQLVCVDPLTGDLLWSRDGIKTNSRVWGDDEHVFVAGSVSARVFELSDGRELPAVDIPTPERRWTTIGRNIVAWDNGPKVGDATSRALCLFDPLNQQNVWTREFVYFVDKADDDGETFKVYGAGCIADDQFALVIEPDGRSVVVDLASGDLVGEFKFEIPEQPKLVRAKLLVTSDQFVVSALLQLRAHDDFTILKPNDDTSINEGFVQAINRQTGKAQWASPVKIDRFGLLDRQPRDIPVLLFARAFRPKLSSGSVTPRSDIVCLDRRDGRWLFGLPTEKTLSSEYRIQASSEAAIDFRFPNNKLYRLQFSNDPVSPSPPAEVTIDLPPVKPEDVSKAARPILDRPPARVLDEKKPFDFGK
ncbi:PQQ-binding-like beta-propeller repeat protein, partial [Planctomycetota bacterium]